MIFFSLILCSILCGKIPTEGCQGYDQPPDWFYVNKYESESFSEIPEIAFSKMKSIKDEIIQLWINDYPPSMEEIIYNNFRGAAGRAYLFLRLYKTERKDDYLKLSKEYIEEALKHTAVNNGEKDDLREIGYLKGDIGVFTVASFVYHFCGEKKKEEIYVEKVLNLILSVIEEDETDFDEGMSGLVHLSRVMNQFYGVEIVPDVEIKRILNLLYLNGVKYYNKTCDALQFKPNSEEWPGWWIGVGCGSSGSIIQLLRSKEIMNNTEISKNVEKTLNYYLTQQDQSGKVRSDYPNRVQWCHGSPGFIAVFLEAYKFFKEDKYLDAARKAARYTIKNGILQKGMSLGHGTSGNIYLVLELYKYTKEDEFLSGAISMLLTSLEIPEYMDKKKWKSYDCVPGAMWISSQGGLMLLFSDLLSHKGNITETSMPIFSLEW